MYIFGPTAGNWIEFGWTFDRPNLNTVGPYVFDARSYNGAATLPRNDGNLADGQHSFAFFYDSTDQKWHFRLDSVLKPYTRSSAPFVNGHPNAGGELRNDCDDGNSHWGLLARLGNGGAWSDWPDNGYICDLEIGEGYDHNSDTDFQILVHGDTFISNNPPNATPNAQPGSCDPMHQPFI
jgi:hypothetical protein